MKCYISAEIHGPKAPPSFFFCLSRHKRCQIKKSKSPRENVRLM